MQESEFDIVVVGGGSAGCAIAGRLAGQSALRVGLIEAGPDYGAFDSGRWPPELLDPRRRPHSHDWGYAESRARVIGGCSAHNQCAAIWAVPEDFDRWAALGNPGWSYAEIRRLIDEIECDRVAGPEPYRGHEGRVPTRPYPPEEISAWHQAFLEASTHAGLPRIDDLSAPEPAIGVTTFHANVERGVRWNSAFAFLDPVRASPNLTVMAETMADRLILHNGRAEELVCSVKGESRHVRADHFILAGGTYGSPPILLRSGVGPADHLREIGIPLELELRGVGENLHDHPGMSIAFDARPEMTSAMDRDRLLGKFYQSQMNARGRSRHCDSGFDLHLISYENLTRGGKHVLKLTAYNMAPLSRGRVRLTGRDPALAPGIEPGYLTDREGRDLAVLLDAFGQLRMIGAAEPIARLAEESRPGKNVADRAGLEDYIRKTVEGYSHPAGTCKMGPESDTASVTGTDGRVHGIANVYMADASIIPQLPRANINLLCFLIGWKIAGQFL